jgi:hypothetical protein
MLNTAGVRIYNIRMFALKAMIWKIRLSKFDNNLKDLQQITCLKEDRQISNFNLLVDNKTRISQ